MFIKSDPRNEVYYKLIDLAFDICDQFVLVVRKDLSPLYEEGISLLDELNSFLIEAKQSDRWPGTWTLSDKATVYYYKTDPHAKNIIKKYSNCQHNWIQPYLPEDLSFLKSGEPWLINTAHEFESHILTQDKEEIAKILAIQGLDVRL